MTRLGLTTAWLCCFGLCTADAAKSPKASAPAPSWLLEIEHTPRQPHSGQEVKITARVKPNVSTIKLEYQIVEPGAYVEVKDPKYQRNWVSIPMQPGPSSQDQLLLEAVLPGQLQTHR